MRQWILSLVIQTSSGERALYKIPVYAESSDYMEFSAKRHVKMMHSSSVDVETYKFEEIVPHDPGLIPRLIPLEKMRGSMILKAEEPEYRDLQEFVERSYDGVEETKVDPILNYKDVTLIDFLREHPHYTEVELYHEDKVVNEIEQSEPMIQRAIVSVSFWGWLWKKLTGCASCKAKRKYQKLNQDDDFERELGFLSGMDD